LGLGLGLAGYVGVRVNGLGLFLGLELSIGLKLVLKL